MLHRSAFKVVAASGIENVTVRSVSKGCGLSDPFIYQCYSDLPELMTDAFLKIDREIADLISSVIQEQLSVGSTNIEGICWVLWSAYWNFLMQDPDKVIFYWRFYQSGYYNREILEMRLENFSAFNSLMYAAGEKTRLDQITNIDAVVSSIIDSTMSIAVKIHLGYVQIGDIPTQAIYGTVFSYLMHLLGVDVWQVIQETHEKTGVTEK